METINDRIARCIIESNLTKTAFAQRIGLTQAYVSALSIGRKLPSDRTISDICREFNVSEMWLRTGEGDMFRQTPDAQAEKLARDYGLDELGHQIMLAYLRLDESDRLTVGKLLQSLIDAAQAKPETKPQKHSIHEMTREELHAELDRELDLERGAETSPAISGFDTPEKIS